MNTIQHTFLATLLCAPLGFAQSTVPSSFNFQSKLYTPTGQPFASPQGQATQVTFKLYSSESATNHLYEKKIPVQINGGYLEATIDDQPGWPPINDIVKVNGTLFVGVQIGGDAELKPRMQLGSTPFAGHANYSNTSGVAEDVPQKAITPASITINGVQVFDASAGLNATSIKIGGSTIVDASKNMSVTSLDLGGNDVIEPDGDIVIRKSPGSPQLQFDNQSGVAGIDASLVLTSDDDLRISSANLTVSEILATDKGLYAPFIEVRELNGSGLPAIQFANLGTPGGQNDARLELSTDDEVTLSGANLKLFGSNLIVTGSITTASTRAGFIEIEDALTPGIDFTLTPGDVGPGGQGDYSARLIMSGQDSMNLLDSDFIVDGTISANGYNPPPSDARLKESVRVIDGALESLLALEGVRFVWTEEARRAMRFPKGPQVGFIAQDLEKVVPEAVVPPGDQGEYYRASYEKLIPVIVEGVKEYVNRTDAELAAKTAENAAQAKRIDDLEAKLEALAARLEAIERR